MGAVLLVWIPILGLVGVIITLVLINRIIFTNLDHNEELLKTYRVYRLTSKSYIRVLESRLSAEKDLNRLLRLQVEFLDQLCRDQADSIDSQHEEPAEL